MPPTSSTSFVSRLPPTVPGPRWRRRFDAFARRPLTFLGEARRRYGDVVGLTDGLSILSRTRPCAGAVAVFGVRNNEAVLTSGAFTTPTSFVERLGLPRTLLNLASGLFRMSGEQHRRRRAAIAPAFGRQRVHAYQRLVAATCDEFFDSWTPDTIGDLTAAMRGLAILLMEAVLMGATRGDARSTGTLVHGLLAHRRGYAVAPDAAARRRVRTGMLPIGDDLDAALRRHVRDYRARADSTCVLAELSNLRRRNTAFALSEDELIGHANALFLAGSEPIAVALAWTVLLLTQRPDLRARLGRRDAGLPVEWIINESLRLFPPNAVMARVTRRPTTLAGHRLPARCEVVLSPYLSHRDGERFPEPDTFRPERWDHAAPSPFEYLPFGAGDRRCLGRGLATSMMATALGALFDRYDVVLDDGQTVNWTLAVTLMPAGAVRVGVRRRGRTPARGARLEGPVRDLVRVD